METTTTNNHEPPHHKRIHPQTQNMGVDWGGKRCGLDSFISNNFDGGMKRTGFANKPRKPLKRTPFRSKTGLTRGGGGLRRTKLRKVGVIGKANLEANRRLKEVLAGITICEVKLKDCLGGMFLTNAHRHKRAWYKGDVELLSDYKQVIRACVNCHDKIEFDEDLTEEMFIRLRKEE